MRVKEKGKVIPTSNLKIVGRELFAGANKRKKRNSYYNWLVIRAHVLKHLSEARENKKEGSKGNVKK